MVMWMSVTTTIVETGLDVPNANTIIVHDADRLDSHSFISLCRVGRSKRSAYAFLMYTRNKSFCPRKFQRDP